MPVNFTTLDYYNLTFFRNILSVFINSFIHKCILTSWYYFCSLWYNLDKTQLVSIYLKAGR